MTTLDDVLAVILAFITDNYPGDLPSEVRIKLLSGRKIQMPFPARLPDPQTPKPGQGKPGKEG